MCGKVFDEVWKNEKCPNLRVAYISQSIEHYDIFPFFNFEILCFLSFLALPRHLIKLVCNTFVNVLRILNQIITSSWTLLDNEKKM